MDKYEDILKLFKVSTPVGYSAEEIDSVKAEVGALPFELESFFLKYGASKELHGLHDELILPNRYKSLLKSDYIVFFNQNQGVCQAAVKKSDVHLPDPPVYASLDNGNWILSSPHVSEFLCAMFDYQASMCLAFNPEEFYFVFPEEREEIEQMFPKLGSFENWLYDCDIAVYGKNGGRIALIEKGSGILMSYAANNEQDYSQMRKDLENIGVAI